MNLLLLTFGVLASIFVRNEAIGPKPKICLKPGLLCETCTNLVICIKTEESWIKDTIETCEDPSRCVDGACVNNTSDPFCSGLADTEFICRKTGIFPDPFYCDQFVLCVDSGSGLKPYVNQCEDGFGYNIQNSLCDVRLGVEGCRDGVYPVPICKEVGQSAALAGKPEIFYVCEDYSDRHFLYPVLNVCPGGDVYEDFQCVDKGSLTTRSDSTVEATTAATVLFQTN